MVLYENKETLRKERLAKEKLERIYEQEFHKLPIQYSLDFAVTERGSVPILYWCELKCRLFRHTKYDSYILSFEKILAARALTQATGLPSFVCLAFEDDVILKTRIDDVQDWAVEWGGRTAQKRREADVHPVVKIDRDWFERIA